MLFKQADSRWGRKPYPLGSTMSGCGCGCVACTHIIIEQEKYKNYTPENVRPWMVNQGFAIRGQGTTWNGITKTLEHYGYKVVHIGINDPMSKAWAELDKGNRIGIILFRSGRAPNGTVWTSSGHYVAFTDYKVKDGLHYFYTKDSGGRDHDSAKHGYYSFEKSMKGTVYQMWIVERIDPIREPITPPDKLTIDGNGGKSTVAKMQSFFDTKVDGIISGQKIENKEYYSALHSIEFGGGGSSVIKKLQAWLGVKQDGILGKNTTTKWQEKLKTLGYYNGAIDGKFGPKSMKAWQEALNNNCVPKEIITSEPILGKDGGTTKLTVDGKGGKSTVKAMQKFFGTKQDGVISGQKKANKKYYSSISSVNFGKGGSTLVKKLQNWVGAKPDGVLGQGTAKKWQKKLQALGYYSGAIDGYFGAKSMKAWQTCLNNNGISITPIPTPTPIPAPTPAPVALTKIEKKAMELAWAKGTAKAKYAYKTGAPTAQFKSAIKAIFSSPTKKKMSRCDAAVAAVIKAAGIEKIPAGNKEQLKYKPKKLGKKTYKNVSPYSVAKPGYAVVYQKKNGKRHSIIMGTNQFYEAQYQNTFFHTKKDMSKLKTKQPKVVVFYEK